MRGWIQLTTEAIDTREPATFLRSALGLLYATNKIGTAEEADASDTEELMTAMMERARRMKNPDDRAWGVATTGVLGDLMQQGWLLKFTRKHLWGQRPLAGMTRDALRERLVVRRNEQLAKQSVRAFIRNMERWRLYRGQRTSVICLLRDGRTIAAKLASGTPLSDLIDPYIQFVSADSTCELTGLKTQDIWRYFRHTWSNPYESVPGRSLQFIVRDRAADFHPVIGIAALSSAAVRLGPRDRFIGWDTDLAAARLLNSPSAQWHGWAAKVLQGAIDEIYKVDLVRDGLLPTDQRSWTSETAEALARVGADAKAQHHRLMAAQEYKAAPDVWTEEACAARAEMPLFRAKRCLELSKLIPLFIQIQNESPSEPERKDLLGKVIRIARGKSVGTEIADLTVCGAIAPYSHLSAGKLVAMLATTPAVIAEYKRRYAGSPGVIASSMAGRPIGRPANLCYIGTTSLYGRRPNQYDRLSMPAELVGGPPGKAIRYEFIRDATDSRTQGIGTFQFSSKTLKGLERFVSSRRGGWKANNLFGEGTSPKLRGLRDGLIGLGLNADELLIHGIERCMYGVKLAWNLDRYLLGMAESPEWVFDPGIDSAPQVSRWWVARWAQSRCDREDVLSLVRREGLAHPIRHGGRVRLPEQEGGQGELL